MKTLIIGGGMAGLTYGILAATSGEKTLICERNSRVGKKISATGNGKCNLGNANVSLQCFNSSKIVKAVLNAVSVERYVEFLKDCGIYTFCDAAGRMYPLSESASNVVDCLRTRYARCGGETLCDCTVTSVKRKGSVFEVDFGSRTDVFDKVVLACGSASGTSQQSNVSQIVEKRFLTPLVPALVPVKTKTNKILNGLRAKANVTLFADGVAIAKESGEVQFRDFGLSGICIFNLSSIIARNSVRGENHRYSFTVDTVPSLSLEDLTEILQKRICLDKAEREAYFYGILHNKIAEYVVLRAEDTTAEQLAKTAKNLTFDFERLLDFSVSQVTAGGIDDKFVDETTLALPNGVIALGEVLNVDGICGGNNLYFAAASAMYAFCGGKNE